MSPHAATDASQAESSMYMAHYGVFMDIAHLLGGIVVE